MMASASKLGWSIPCVAVVMAACASFALGEDWPNFRGPRYDGISREAEIRTEWDSPIPFVWDREVGSAFSSLACVGDRVYTCGASDGWQVLYCLNAYTGDIVWWVNIAEEYREPQGGDGTRATPTVSDGRVYILGARGILLCVEADSGRQLWGKKFQHMPRWGYSGSVLIEGPLAIATGGDSDGTLVAFEKITGRLVWRCGDERAGYATPYPFTFEGKRYIVGFAGESAIIAEAGTGRLVCRIPWETSYDVNAATPIFHEGHLFLSSGYRTGCALFKLRGDGDGLAARLIWQSRVLMNKFQTPVLFEGALYGSDQKALVCADFLTGEERWRVRRVKHGTVLLAVRHLFLLTQRGQLQIAPASTMRFDPVTTANLLSGRCWTAPVLSRGKLYVRSMTRVACFDVGR